MIKLIVKHCDFRGGKWTFGALRWGACPLVQSILREVESAARTMVRDEQELYECVLGAVGRRMSRHAAQVVEVDCLYCMNQERDAITGFVASRVLAAYAEGLKTRASQQVQRVKQGDAAPPGAKL